MKKVKAALQALGILLGTWGLLVLVGAIAGVLQPIGGTLGARLGAGDAAGENGESGEGASPEGGNTAETAQNTAQDGGVDDTAATDTEGAQALLTDTEADTDTATDTTDGSADGQPDLPRPSTARARHIVCEGTETPPIVDAIDSGNFVVGCGPHVDVLTRWPEGSDRLFRTVRVVRSAAHPRARVEVSALAHADIDGDGRDDLVIGFQERNEEGSTVGGALVLLPSAPGGGFGEPVELAPIPVVSLALGNVNDHEAIDIVALHRPDSYGRRPAEAWVFAGGASPTRTARLDAGNALSVVLADLDRDGKLDILAGKAAGSARVYFGDGEGRFERRAEVALAPGVETLAFDVDSDGGTDVLTLGDTVRLVRAAGPTSLASAELNAPAGMRSANAVDINGDGQLDLAGIAGDGIVLVPYIQGVEFGAVTLVDLPLHAGSPRWLWAGRSPDGLRLAVLTRLAGETEPFTLVMMRGTEPSEVSPTPTPVRDAPLMLHFELH